MSGIIADLKWMARDSHASLQVNEHQKIKLFASHWCCDFIMTMLLFFSDPRPLFIGGHLWATSQNTNWPLNSLLGCLGASLFRYQIR
jgi:hypothetical protein